MSLPVEAIQALSDRHPKPSHLHFQYGTAGFRTLYVLFRRNESVLMVYIVQGEQPGIRYVQGWNSGRVA